MNGKNSIIKLHIFANSIVQMMMTAGISFAAIHFERISVLWFYLIPAILMSANYGNYKAKDGESNE